MATVYWRRIGIVLLTAALGLALQVGSAQSGPASPPHVRKRATRKKVAKVPTPTPTPEPTPVPTPLPPEQMPPAAPQVTYNNGQLTIQSSNSTLASILRTAATRLGATVDLPPGAGSERIATKLGPGAPHDVLAALLLNCKFDYILAGSPGDPDSVNRIVLTPAGSTPTQAPGAIAQRPPQPQPQPDVQSSPDESSIDQEVPDEPPPDAENEPPDQPMEPQPLPSQPGTDQAAPPAGQAADQGQGDPNQPKTPEQLLQELQRMQQQQQQRNQQPTQQ